MLRKTIIVPIAKWDANENALIFGLWLAQNFHAHMDAVYIQDRDIHIPFDMGANMVKEILSDAHDESKNAENATRQKFDECLFDANIRHASEVLLDNSATANWSAIEGDDQEVVAEQGSLYDLIVVNRPNQGYEPFSGTIVKSAIFNTRRPVLVAPPCFKDVYYGTKIGDWKAMIAWNRTVHAATAVSNAMPLLECVKSVELLSVQTGAKKGVPAGEVAQQLERREVKVSVKEIVPDSRSVGQMLLAEAMEFGASLLIMGAYSHNRMKEFVLGGVTRHILDQAEIPVLMSH